MLFKKIESKMVNFIDQDNMRSKLIKSLISIFYTL